ncbi:hypothetical protein I7I53_08829 [Histoplasma capsulatum var. duboisii H88]|uniref:Uncharacterized protein n=1 Tax=Ajellomyces capsulatus (strain H88) TaxID=544711 RepID=A0A8A1L7M9_AJEC8|nr:hypothetical protein I7I53_08829 [Histoplasma capsulatum var. duboisii H88]
MHSTYFISISPAMAGHHPLQEKYRTHFPSHLSSNDGAGSDRIGWDRELDLQLSQLTQLFFTSTWASTRRHRLRAVDGKDGSPCFMPFRHCVRRRRVYVHTKGSGSGPGSGSVCFPSR